MSPEQIIGKGIDTRSDLFSVGVLLAEMLAGRKPFGGDSVVSITYAIMNAPTPPLPGVPSAVEQVILRALTKDPRYRTPSAEQMKQELRAAEQMPAQSYSPSGQIQLTPPPPGVGYPAPGTGYPGVPPPPPFAMPGSMPSDPYGYATPQAGYGSGALPPAQGQISAGAPSGPVGPLPWNWNNGQPGGGNPSGALVPSGAATPGAYPFGMPPFPRRRAPIKITLPPWVRTVAIAIVIAGMIGGGIGFAAVAFLNGYDRYRADVGAQRIETLMNQAVTAYQTNNFAQAASLLEQAKAAGPTDRQMAALNFNLGATYIQLARLRKSAGNWPEAQADYQKALAINADSKIAHDGLAGVLERLNQPAAARDEHTAAQNSTDTRSVPSALQPPPPAGLDTSAEANAGGAEQFREERQAKARQLLQAGTTWPSRAAMTKRGRSGRR